MMQNVATTSSDIAGFASELKLSMRQELEPNDNFGQHMQDQEAKKLRLKTGKKQPVEQTLAKPNHAPDKTLSAERQVITKAQNTDKSDLASQKGNTSSEQQTDLDKVGSQTNQITSPLAEQANTEAASSTDRNPKEKDQTRPSLSQEFATSNLPVEGELSAMQAQLTFTQEQNTSENNANLGATTDPSGMSETQAQQWVSLVQSYQKLAELAKSSDPLPEQPVSLDITDLVAKDSENALLATQTLQQVLTKQDVDNITDTQVKLALGDEQLTTDEDQPIALGQVDLAKDERDKPLVNALAALQNALENISANAIKDGSSEVPKATSQAQLTEAVLADSQLLQTIQSELTKATKVTPDETKTLNEAAKLSELKQPAELPEHKKPAESLELKQHSDANNQLLKTLLETPQTVIEPVSDVVKVQGDLAAEVAQLQSEHKIVQPTVNPVEQVKLFKNELYTQGLQPSLPPVQELVDKQDTEIKLNPIAQALVAPSTNVANKDKGKSLDDVKFLANLPEKKLDKALQQIAQRLLSIEPSSEQKTAELKAPQLSVEQVIKTTSEVKVSAPQSSKELIGALKSGLEEFKSQVAQGREPGLDLKALLSDAMVKTSEVVTVKPSSNFEQIVQSVSKVIDFAQSIGRVIDSHQEQTYSNMLKDVSQIQGEQSKSSQLSQFEAKFDKAVNINKPEGHQQLAEKVRWMVNTKNLVAEIRLDPADLGSVNVKVAMSGESATVNFVVQSQQAREAMDNATPRLREMLAEKGIELGQSSVEQESQEKQAQGEDELAKQSGLALEADTDEGTPEASVKQQPIVNGALGGIDYFV